MSIHVVKGRNPPYEIFVQRGSLQYPIEGIFNTKKESIKTAKKFERLDGGKYIVRHVKSELNLQYLK